MHLTLPEVEGGFGGLEKTRPGGGGDCEAVLDDVEERPAFNIQCPMSKFGIGGSREEVVDLVDRKGSGGR